MGGGIGRVRDDLVDNRLADIGNGERKNGGSQSENGNRQAHLLGTRARRAGDFSAYSESSLRVDFQRSSTSRPFVHSFGSSFSRDFGGRSEGSWKTRLLQDKDFQPQGTGQKCPRLWQALLAGSGDLSVRNSLWTILPQLWLLLVRPRFIRPRTLWRQGPRRVICPYAAKTGFGERPLALRKRPPAG